MGQMMYYQYFLCTIHISLDRQLSPIPCWNTCIYKRSSYSYVHTCTCKYSKVVLFTGHIRISSLVIGFNMGRFYNIAIFLVKSALKVPLAKCFVVTEGTSHVANMIDPFANSIYQHWNLIVITLSSFIYFCSKMSSSTHAR